MTLSAEQRQIFTSHTANMPPRERIVRVNALIARYRITNEEDQREVARIAAVRMEDVM